MRAYLVLLLMLSLGTAIFTSTRLSSMVWLWPTMVSASARKPASRGQGQPPVSPPAAYKASTVHAPLALGHHVPISEWKVTKPKPRGFSVCRVRITTVSDTSPNLQK